MEELIRFAEKIAKDQQKNVIELADRGMQLHQMTNHQKALFDLGRRRRQDTHLSERVFEDALTETIGDTEIKIYQFGHDPVFNPLSMLETQTIEIDNKISYDWVQLLTECIDNEIAKNQTPYDMVMRVFESWHTDFMPKLKKVRGNARSSFPGIYIRNPIWTIRSIVYHLYHNTTNQKFSELIDSQAESTILNATRTKMLDPGYTPRTADISLMRQRRRYNPYQRPNSQKTRSE
jgi:hypothetical protein